MWRAISLGVFCRAAPSTRAIIRSRKDSPGLAVIRTTIRSESTRVPPVTALRSPPLSRMTGADSPVIALSSTEAMPSMTSPSPGMYCPASTTTVSPLRRMEAATFSSRPSTSFRASISLRIFRSDAAWALPRPSATASAKLAKSTVNQSQRDTSPVNHSGGGWVRGADVPDELDRGQERPHLDHEHHRVPDHLAAETACGSSPRSPDGRWRGRRATALGSWQP